jgi:CBS domain-containing protein
MRISEVIRRKGRDVVTVRSSQTVAELLALLAAHGIGAVVVSDDGGATVAGIVSERDIVRHLQLDGPQVVQLPVAAIMSRVVQTCTLEDDLEALARQMTEHRVRHVPVIVDDRLYAIVSIGDIVKHRIDELQAERDQLVGYIQQ